MVKLPSERQFCSSWRNTSPPGTLVKSRTGVQLGLAEATPAKSMHQASLSAGALAEELGYQVVELSDWHLCVLGLPGKVASARLSRPSPGGVRPSAG